MKKLTVFVLSAFLFVACSGGSSFKAGDGVIVEWFENSWHEATVVVECGEAETAGYTVDFVDNFYDAPAGESATCYKTVSVIKNEAPKEGEVAANDKVLGEWVEDAFYTATLEKVSGATYTLKYDDGYSQDVTVDKIRLLPKEQAK